MAIIYYIFLPSVNGLGDSTYSVTITRNFIAFDDNLKENSIVISSLDIMQQSLWPIG